MRNAGLEEAQAGTKIARRNINNLRYADDTTLMAENEEELNSLLMEVKEKSEKVNLKLNIEKTKIMASSPIIWWQTDGETMETVTDFIFLGSKITAADDLNHTSKRRNDAKAETPVHWPPHAKTWLIGKDSHAGRDWGKEESGNTGLKLNIQETKIMASSPITSRQIEGDSESSGRCNFLGLQNHWLQPWN